MLLFLKEPKKMGVESFHFDKKAFQSAHEILSLLQERKIDFIILAGFLLKIPEVFNTTL